MDSYFVEGQVGEKYITNKDPDLIEQHCEQTGDHDTILFSFNDEDKDEPFKSIGQFLTKSLFFSRKKMIERLLAYNAVEVGVTEAVKRIKLDLIYEIDTNKDMVKSLLETKNIDKKTCNKLIKYLDKMLKKQMSFISEFDYMSINLKKEKNKMMEKK